MATHQLQIGPAGMRPNADGVFFQPYSIVDTATILDPLVLTYGDTGTKDGAAGTFIVPQNYVGTAKLHVLWVANAISGNCIWDLSYLTRTDAEDMGAAATDTADTVTTGTDGTAFNLNTSTMTLTAGDFAPGDVVAFELFRDTANASDTLAQSSLVFAVIFEYADA